jgi:erythromycin esterase-like protein
MAEYSEEKIAAIIDAAAYPLESAAADYDALLEGIRDARFVLIGEASHGTHEFYRERASITQRLIAEKGFCAVAVEADWPDAYRVNRYVQGTGDGTSSLEALEGFKRFPTWMWRNTVVVEFIEWLRKYNQSLPANRRKAGFYGLDLYSLYSSIEAVLQYLAKVDPEAAKRAHYRYSCFEDFGEDTQAYGYAAGFELGESCERETVDQLVELQRQAASYAHRDGRLAEDEYFFAQQNARLVKNAEEYYREMFRGRVSSWNLRDRHMAETLGSLADHLSREGEPAKIVVWEHNSHLGDARATEMGDQGELNVGQLVRERYGQATCAVGLSTYAGTVTAASNWDAPAERKRVRPALPGSYERLFHIGGRRRFLLNLQEETEAVELLHTPRLQRAIGVIYRPETERISHYFHARLPDQFDYMIHLDETGALEPLERTAGWEAGEQQEASETYPTGL